LSRPSTRELSDLFRSVSYGGLTDRTAKIYRTSYSKTPLENLINTGLFDFGQAAMGAGWLQSLKEESTIQIDDGKGGKKTVPKPETLE
jgi:hypothetical protein